MTRLRWLWFLLRSYTHLWRGPCWTQVRATAATTIGGPVMVHPWAMGQIRTSVICRWSWCLQISLNRVERIWESSQMWRAGPRVVGKSCSSWLTWLQPSAGYSSPLKPSNHVSNCLWLRSAEFRCVSTQVLRLRGVAFTSASRLTWHIVKAWWNTYDYDPYGMWMVEAICKHGKFFAGARLAWLLPSGLWWVPLLPLEPCCSLSHKAAFWQELTCKQDAFQGRKRYCNKASVPRCSRVLTCFQIFSDVLRLCWTFGSACGPSRWLLQSPRWLVQRLGLVPKARKRRSWTSGMPNRLHVTAQKPQHVGLGEMSCFFLLSKTEALWLVVLVKGLKVI